MDKLQQLRDKINAGHSSKGTQTRKEWPFPNVKMSALQAGSYPVRLLPKHPDKNPAGFVDFPQRIIPAAGDKKLYYNFASEHVDPQDEAVYTKYFDHITRLAYPFKEALESAGFQREFKELKCTQGARIPVAIYCNKTVKWKDDNKYANYTLSPAEPGKGEWFGCVLDLTQKSLIEKLLEDILSAWQPSEWDLSEGVRPCDPFDPENGRSFTFSKSGTGLNTVYDVKMSTVNTPINDQVKALYADGEYPDVVASVQKMKKPKLDLISNFQQSNLAAKLKSFGIDVMQDPPVMVTPVVPTLSLGL